MLEQLLGQTGVAKAETSDFRNWDGVVLETATAANDSVKVAITGADNQRHEHGPCAFIPRGNLFPQAGDPCLVTFDDNGTPWITMWTTGRSPSGAALVSEINVLNPPGDLAPVLADGSNQSAHAQALIDWVEARATPPVMLYWPAGVYRVSGLRITENAVNMRGDGEDATFLRRPAGVNGTLLRIGGATWPDHGRVNRLEGMTLHGNDGTGLLLYPAYIDNLTVQNIKLVANLDTALDFTECWDSDFANFVVDSCGGTDGTKPAVYVRCARTASGDGSTTDNSNMIRFRNVRIEAWRDGGLWIDKGPSGFTGHGFWFENLKVESYSVRGRGIVVADARHVKIRNFYVYLGAFASGFSTPVNAIENSGNDGLFEDGEIGNGATATILAGLMNWVGARNAIIRVRPIYATAPTSGLHINWAGGWEPWIEDCESSTAAQDTAWKTVSYMTNWRRYTNNAAYEVQVKKVGHVVTLRGMVERITSAFSYAGAGPGDDSHFCTLPVGYRPARVQNLWFMGGATGSTLTRVIVLPTGEMYTDLGGPASAGAAFGGAGSYIYCDDHSWSTI